LIDGLVDVEYPMRGEKVQSGLIWDGQFIDDLVQHAQHETASWGICSRSGYCIMVRRDAFSSAQAAAAAAASTGMA
jgi:hypothetical protein